MTRYETYRYEIESMNFPNSNMPGVPRPPAEGGVAMENGFACQYTQGDPSDPQMPYYSDPSLDADDTGADEIDRRMLVLTAVNCIEHGPLHGNQPDGIPVEGYIQVFLTEPTVQGGPEGLRVWGELAGTIDRGTEGLRDIVQLYR